MNFSTLFFIFDIKLPIVPLVNIIQLMLSLSYFKYCYSCVICKNAIMIRQCMQMFCY